MLYQARFNSRDVQGYSHDLAGFGAKELQQAVDLAVGSGQRFLLLDFSQVTGVDATAARTFGLLKKQLLALGVELVVTGVKMEKR